MCCRCHAEFGYWFTLSIHGQTHSNIKSSFGCNPEWLTLPIVKIIVCKQRVDRVNDRLQKIVGHVSDDALDTRCTDIAWEITLRPRRRGQPRGRVPLIAVVHFHVVGWARSLAVRRDEYDHDLVVISPIAGLIDNDDGADLGRFDAIRDRSGDNLSGVEAASRQYCLAGSRHADVGKASIVVDR
jgi:hypothetical protein